MASTPSLTPTPAFPSPLSVWMNGRMVAPSDAGVSVFDHGVLYGDGVFEGIRFYDRLPFRLEAHLARLERSAAAIMLDLPYDQAALGEAVRTVVERSSTGDGYLRIVATRGAGDLGLDPRSCAAPNVFVLSAPLRVFADAPEGGDAGIDVIIASTRQLPLDVIDPRIKSLSYLNRILARLEAMRAGAAEAIMLDATGHLAEGAADNVFLVRERVLLTPPAVDGALEGITRDVVLDLAVGLGIAVREASLAAYDLRVADEAFLSGTGAGLVPIRQVDGRRLRSCPGPVYRQVCAAFEALVRRSLPR